jgi:hypothetical protein
VRDYYDLEKFNLVELAQNSATHTEKGGDTRAAMTGMGDSAAEVYARMTD